MKPAWLMVSTHRLFPNDQYPLPGTIMHLHVVLTGIEEVIEGTRFRQIMDGEGQLHWVDASFIDDRK